MIKCIVSDLSFILLFPKDKEYQGTLNGLYRQLIEEKGSFDFYDYFEINDELFEYLKLIRKQYPLYIYTTGIVQEDPAIYPLLLSIFQASYSVQQLDLPKDQVSSYTSLATIIEFKPSEILYIDDSQDNITRAQEANFNTIHFQNTEQALQEFSEHLQ